MAQFLTFALVAPLASFGDVAVGERRGGFDRPARSAVLGLVAACLGLERSDAQAQAALAEGYGLALLCHAPGTTLADYHTVQTGKPRRGQRFATRAEELAAEDVSTILTRRDYRQGAWHLAALWPRGAPRWSLESLAEAMRRPVFTPYLGRKSCPLGLPLAPRLYDAPDARAALLARHANGAEALFPPADTGAFRRRMAPAPGPLTLATDLDGLPDGATPARVLRRDQPLSRAKWQFGLREEAIITLPAP